MILKAARLVWRAFNRFLDHSGPDRAAAVAYYTLLSLLPLLIFLISVGVAVMGSFDRAWNGTIYLVGGVVVHLDAAQTEALRQFVERAVRLQWPGIFLLAWTSRRIFAALFGALEVVFGVQGRSFAHGHLVALAMVMGTGIALFGTLALTTVIATVEGMVERLSPFDVQAVRGLTAIVLTRVVPAAIAFAFFFIIYRLVPRKVVSVAHAATGALMATVLWELAKAGFAYYVRNLAHYAGIYGALEAVLVLALWLELSVSVILFCGEVVALLIHTHQPSHDPAKAEPVTA